MKKLIAIILLLTTVFLFSCSTIDQVHSKAAKANELAEQFCFALSFDDIEKAKEYLHPDLRFKKGNLENYLKEFEADNDIDFSNGVAIKTRFSERIVIYDSRYNGDVYTVGIKMVIGNKVLKLYFIIVDNDKGYGLHDFGLYTYRPN